MEILVNLIWFSCMCSFRSGIDLNFGTLGSEIFEITVAIFRFE